MRYILALLIASYSFAVSPFYDTWQEQNQSAELLPQIVSGYYDESLTLYGDEELSKIAVNAYGVEIVQNGVIVENCDLRAWPSVKPMFKSSKQAGEGFPFDYAQHSELYIGMPVKILRQSVDRQWYFVLSPVNYGWVQKRYIAFISEQTRVKVQNIPLCTPLADETMKNEIATPLRVGMALPCDENKTFIPVKNLDGFTQYTDAPKLPTIPISEDDRKKAAYSLLGKKYGWGGIYGNRDCSMLTRDVFVGANIWLKRNSKQQAATDETGYIDLSQLSSEKKKSLIVQNGVPWHTILYMKGHVVLYIGHKNGEPLVYQAVWGIKTYDFFGNEGRHIIGQTTISTLDLDTSVNGYSQQKSSLVPKILGMRTFTKETN